MTASDTRRVRRRPVQLIVVTVLGYVQAALSAGLAVLLFIAVADTGFAAEYNVDNAALIAAVVLIVAALIIGTVSTGVLLGVRFMRGIMLVGLAIGVWGGISTALQGGALIFWGIAHIAIGIVIAILLFTPPVNRYFARP